MLDEGVFSSLLFSWRVSQFGFADLATTLVSLGASKMFEATGTHITRGEGKDREP